MDFALSADQEALRDGVRAFCEGRVGIEQLRRLEGSGFERGLWGELSELGVFGLRMGERDAAGEPGEAESGLAEAVLVFEMLGRALAPGPILWTHLAAGLVPGAAAGEVVVTGIEAEASGRGTFLIEHLDSADVLLVLREDGVARLDAKAIAAGAASVGKPLDPFTPLHRVATLPRGEPIADAATADRLRLEGATLSAALLLGIAEETLALATRHATERQQFDRPIGSFQAIKHMLADAYVRQELARASVYAAGVLLDESAGNAADRRARTGASVDEATHRAVATAKLVAGEAAMKNSRVCIQVHGGMGFTWENPVHYYLKRTWVLENGFGTGAEIAARLALATRRPKPA